MPQTETITLRLVAQDLASGNISKAVGGIDKLAQRGGIAGSVLQGVGLSIGTMLNPLALASRGIDTLTDTIGDSIDAASDLEESQAKIGEVFSRSADEVRAWSEDSATSFGLSQQAALEAAGTFGNFMQALGLTEDAAKDMSTGIVELSADLASFNNQSIDSVLVALRSGLAGETEPMRRLGVNISAARIQALGLTKGLVKAGEALTETQKVQLRYEAIMEDTAKAQGDFARTSDGLANSQRILAAQMDDALASLGRALLPVATNFAQFAADTIPVLVDVLDNLAGAFHDLQRVLQPQLALDDKINQRILELTGNNEELAQAIIDNAAADADWQRQVAESQRNLDNRDKAIQQLARQYIGLRDENDNLITSEQEAIDYFWRRDDAVDQLNDTMSEQAEITEAANERIDAYNERQETAKELALALNPPTKDAASAIDALGDAAGDAGPKVGGLGQFVISALDSVRVAVTGFDPFADIGKALSPKEMMLSLRKSLGEANRELRTIIDEGGLFDDKGRDILSGIQNKFQRLLNKLPQLETVKGPAGDLGALYIAQLGTEVLANEEELAGKMALLGLGVQDDFLTGATITQESFRTLFPIDGHLISMGNAIGDVIGMAEKASIESAATVTSTELRATLPSATENHAIGDSIGSTIGEAISAAIRRVVAALDYSVPAPRLPNIPTPTRSQAPWPGGWDGDPSTPWPMAEGGIVTKPTLALLAEKPGSKEAVIPLDRAGRFGGLTLNFNGPILGSGRDFVEEVGPELMRWMHRQ